MIRYENYLETSIEWIGKIPSSWELSRVGKFFTERSEKVDDVTYPPLSVTMNGIVDQLSDVAKSNDNNNRKLVQKNDFVINSRSDRKGSSGIAPRDGSVSLINIVLAPKNIDPKYIENLFKSYYFKEEYFRNGKGIHWDLWTTRWEQFKNINIPIPPIEEQKLISRFLDKKTSQIDLLVEKIQKKINLLNEQRASLIDHVVTKGLDPNVEMKDSGVEWIGEIPKHWDLIKLKYLFSLEGGKDPKSVETKDGIYPIFGTGGEISRSNDFLYDKPTLLLGRKGTIDKPFVVTEPFWVSDVMYFTIQKKEIKPDYLLKLFNLVPFDFYKYGSTQPSMSRIDYENMKFPIPNKDERELITKFLDLKLAKFDTLLKKQLSKIHLLKEYRQSLISSVVTGKVRVTEDMI